MSDPTLPENLPPASEGKPAADTPHRGPAPVATAIRRILVALDASNNSRAALAAALGLAETFHAEIVGLFVEDINLVRLAELPFAREVRFGEVVVHRFERERLERTFRARAAILRREVEELAAEHKVPSTFRVLRGPIDHELLTAAVEGDLLALGRLGHALAHRAPLGSTAQTAVARAASAVLLVKTDVESGPIVVLYDGSAAGQRALALAGEVAAKVGDIRILVWASDEATAFERRQEAVGLLANLDATTQYQHLAGDNPQLLMRWINRQQGSLLIVGGGDNNLPADMMQSLLDDAEQHILIIR